jgi:hypothetical protein
MPGRDPDTPAPWTPATAGDAEAVREQLGRILSSALFRNSKRFPVFLRFTVEHGLSSAEPLKERTIGHEVFARDPAYDTAQDPVVRMTAAEVRKRLVQYYQRPEHFGEIVIAYQSGSYIPDFYRPATLGHTDSPPPLATESPSPLASSRARTWPAAIAAVVLASAVLGAWLIAGHEPVEPRMDAVSRFWTPVLASSSAPLLCIGDAGLFVNQAEEQSTAAVGDMTIQEFLRSDSVRYTDAATLALVAGELRARGKQFRIRRPSATALKDLRDGSVVLIGGFNNPWTRKLSEDWRFTLAADPAGAYVRDREHPDDRRWRPETAGRLIKNLRQTYGLITRVKDAATGQLVLTLSGLVHGTRAAGECVVDATCLQAAERIGGGDRGKQNVQIVVEAAVMGEDSGAPRVIAVNSW